MNHSIATVIQFCTNDYRFLRKNVEEARRFSRYILITVCDHFFNGTPENYTLLAKCYEEFSEYQFIKFKYDPIHLYHPYYSGQIEAGERSKLWHATSRYIGTFFVPPSSDYVLYLDADEIVDGARFKNWLDSKEYLNWNAMRLQADTYVYEPSLKIRSSYPCAFFTKAHIADPLLFLNVQERYGTMRSFPPPKKEGIVDVNGDAFFHRYTWVRPKQECLQKASSWGHRLDKDWTPPIERMFEDPTKELMDLNVEFETTAIFFDPLSVVPPSAAPKTFHFENVVKVDRAAIRKKEVERLL